MVPLVGEGTVYTALAAEQKPEPLPELPKVGGHDADINRPSEPLHHPGGAHDLKAHKPGAVQWPGESTVTVDLKGRPDLVAARRDTGKPEQPAVRAGSTPVLLRTAAGAPAAARAGGSGDDSAADAAPGAVEVKVAGRAGAEKAGVNGLLVSLDRADGVPTPSAVEVSLDYGSFADAFGGGWASRLRLVAMPACALTTPELAPCRTRQPLDTALDPAAQRITATVTLPGATGASATAHAPATAAAPAAPATGGIALGLESGTSGSQGDYRASDLSATGSWSKNASGAFTYDYPITVPPSLAGNAPGVALAYDSQSVDGKTSARNSQASWIGDGWSYNPGFVERFYKTCNNAGVAESGDQCWAGWNATLSLGSHSGELVRDGNGVYHLQNDDGTRVERLTGAANGLWQGEYFKVTTTDGTAYYLGLNHAPGTASDAATNSAWGVPVYHPNNGDPCYNAAKGAGSQCDQQPGWRFNLDFVVDPNGNVQRYDWAAETNRYAMGGGQAATAGGTGTLTAYTRGGQLSRISYGYKLADAVAGREPSARVNFETAERCTVSDTTCRPENLSASTAKNWPDVPYDLACLDGWTTSGSGGTVCYTGSPTFWSTKRLRRIGTELRTEGGWQALDRYDLTHIFSEAGAVIDPATGSPGDANYRDGSLQSVMWLSSIQRTGLDTSAGGSGPITLDPVTFAGTELNNRVDGSSPPTPLYRPRIIGIGTESGARIAVTYRDPECSRTTGAMPASADNNTMACYPVHWSPGKSKEPVADWFHKTLVAKVTVRDGTASASPSRVTSYSYEGGAAWHRDDSDLTDDQYRTWNDFRGYRTVTTTSGSGDDPVTKNSVSFFRGMDGDYKADRTPRSVRLTNSLGEETADSPWLAGLAQESVTYGSASGAAVARQFSDLSVASDATATRTRTAWSSKPPALSPLPELKALRTVTSGTRSSVLLSDGTWRTGRTVTTRNEWGQPLKAESQPDLTTDDNRTCTTTEYADPPAAHPMMRSYPSSTQTVAGPCGTPPSATRTVSDRRVIYDGNADPAGPGAPKVLGQNGTTFGYATATQTVTGYDAQGKAAYRTVSAKAFDGYGRVVRNVNEAGLTEDTSYGPAIDVLPGTMTKTNSLGWKSTDTVSPARGLVTRSVDANNRITDSVFDALGRRTAVWLPGNARADGRPANQTFGYDMRGALAGDEKRVTSPSVTTRTLREDQTWSTSVDILDGFLKSRQTQATPANNDPGRVLTHTRYDSHGQVSKTTAAWYDKDHGEPGTVLFEEKDDESPSQTYYTYDGTGRKTSEELFSRGHELWRTVTSYPGAERTDITPPTGGTPSTVITDALGRTISSVLHGGEPTGDVTTRYAFDARGLLASIADNAGNTWTYSYDVEGRLVSQSDPDAGTSTTVYDALGRVATTTDGNGKRMAFAYDLLGRVIGRYEGDNTNNPAKLLASFTFDNLAKGYPTASTRYVGGASGSAYVQAVDGYDVRYQPTGTTTTIPAAEGKLAGSYSQTLTYSKRLGLPTGPRYHAHGGLPEETFSIYRNSADQVEATSTDYFKILARTNYDQLGHVLLSQYGESGKLMRTARFYDDVTGRLKAADVKFQEADTNPISDITYGYDPAGKLARISERNSSGSGDMAVETQCFRYDGLNRLTEAWTDVWGFTTPTAGQVSRCTHSDPGPANIGGPAPYWQSFQYNQLGDRTQQVKHDITGDTARDVTQTSSYPGEGRTPAAKPNTATSVTTRSGQATLRLTSGQTTTDGAALCLDVWGSRTSDGTAVGTWTCHSGGSERWTRPGDGSLRALGKCARPVGGNAYAGARIELAACDAGSRKWTDGADGALVYDSQYCLEIPGGNRTPGTQLGLWYCNGLSHQQWAATVNAPSGPTYSATLTPQYDAQGNTTSRTTTSTGTLTSGVATGGTPVCLDATGANSANGTPVETWTCHEGGAEQWTLGKDGTLRVLGVCARPTGGQTGPGTQIELWACDGSPSQRWNTAADGSLVHQSGLCLDVPQGSGTPGTRVALWYCNQGSNQKWSTGTTAQPLAGSTQTFVYDVEGRTESVTAPSGSGTATSRYLYDADGDLLLQRGPTGTILYLFSAAEQITLSADGSTVTGERYFPQPDGSVAVRTSGGTLFYQITTPQNTATIQVDAATKAVTRRPFDPYGNLRDGSQPSAWTGNRGYLGKPVDFTTGLNLLGARNYDPVLGRFLTVDPLLAPGNPDQMSGYTYSSNDPVNRMDPSGRIDHDCYDGLCGGHRTPQQDVGPGPHRDFNTWYGPLPAAPPSPADIGPVSGPTPRPGASGNLRHSAAQEMAYEYLKATHPNAWVAKEYVIPGAGKNGAINGSADLVMIEDNVMHIWEVKSGLTGKDEKLAFGEVTDYVSAEQKIQKAKGSSLTVKPGFEIPQLVGPDPMNLNGVLVAQSTSKKDRYTTSRGKPVELKKATGVISWWDRKNAKPPGDDWVPHPITVTTTVWDRKTTTAVGTAAGLAVGFLIYVSTFGTVQ
ncbi:ricin-type beta-trefoil lectin domain protein [Kitasatospora sp. NPDC015120]|uniref:ricin-type beta-trefoil lectin domain protein n=1 Tax=Kitasatospora sp. NPDC015120 TaxID=3364023 RepID=UPI0036F4889D